MFHSGLSSAACQANPEKTKSCSLSDRDHVLFMCVCTHKLIPCIIGGKGGGEEFYFGFCNERNGATFSS